MEYKVIIFCGLLTCTTIIVLLLCKIFFLKKLLTNTNVIIKNIIENACKYNSVSCLIKNNHGSIKLVSDNFYKILFEQNNKGLKNTVINFLQKKHSENNNFFLQQDELFSFFITTPIYGKVVLFLGNFLKNLQDENSITTKNDITENNNRKQSSKVSEYEKIKDLNNDQSKNFLMFFMLFPQPLVILNEKLQIIFCNNFFKKSFHFETMRRNISIYECFAEMVKNEILLQEFNDENYSKMISKILSGESQDIFTLNDEYYRTFCVKTANNMSLIVFQNETQYIRIKNKENHQESLIKFLLNDQKSSMFVFDLYKKLICTNDLAIRSIFPDTNINNEKNQTDLTGYSLKDILVLLKKQYSINIQHILTEKESQFIVNKKDIYNITIKEYQFFTLLKVEKMCEVNFMNIFQQMQKNILKNINVITQMSSTNLNFFTEERLLAVRNTSCRIANDLNKINDYLYVVRDNLHKNTVINDSNDHFPKFLKENYYDMHTFYCELQNWIRNNFNDLKSYLNVNENLNNNLINMHGSIFNMLFYILQLTFEHGKKVNIYMLNNNLSNCFLVINIDGFELEKNDWDILNMNIYDLNDAIKLAMLVLKKNNIYYEIQNSENTLSINIKLKKLKAYVNKKYSTMA